MPRRTLLRHALLAVLPALLVAVTATGTSALVHSFTEDFYTKDYCDTVYTTAWWDTVAGEIKLYPFEIAHVGSIGTGNAAMGVAVAGDRAYVADGNAGLRIIDISDPSNPSFLGALSTFGTANDVEVAGNWAYVADGIAGLTVVNITYPGAGPSETCDTPSDAQSVAIAGDYAYVADGDSGLYVLDITAQRPAYAGNVLTLDWAFGIDVQGNCAYVAADDSGLVVVDISDPANPAVVGRYDTPYWAIDVDVSGDFAYVADYGSGLQIIDVTDPANPTYAGSYYTGGIAYNVSVSGDFAYVSDAYGDVSVINVADASSPTLVGTYTLATTTLDIAIAGGHAFVAAYDGGLHVLEISNRHSPPAYIAELPTPGNAYGIATQGNYAYVADWYDGLRIFDVTVPMSPVFLGVCDTGSRAKAVALSGDYAYVADSDSGVVVIDVSDPANPTRVASYLTGGVASDVAVDGDHLFVSAEDMYLVILDISDPTNPTAAGAYDPEPGYSTYLDVDGNYVLIGDLDAYEVAVIDVSDVSAPSKIGSFSTTGMPTEIAIHGDYAFVSEYGLQLTAVDISDPTNPVVIDGLTTDSFVADIAVDGDLAFLAGATAGIQVVDISNPAFMVLLDTSALLGTRAVALAGDYIFSADEDLGFVVSKAYDRYFDAGRNSASSVTVMASTEPIVKARATTLQSEWVGWWIVQPLGYYYDITQLIPGDWTEIANPGTSFFWVSVHVPLGPGDNPYCSHLTLDWLYECAAIDSIVDIPADQGGTVRLHFTRSGYDFAGDSLLIDMYNIWRRVDDPTLLESLRSEERSDKAALDPDLGLPLLEAEGRRFLMNEGRRLAAGFPPGTWEVLEGFAAVQQDDYIFPAATLGDSTSSGPQYTVYCVSAHTIYPWLWYVSPPDSGYSIDNIAPAPPPGLRMESATEVAWDMVPDNDFQYYSVYGTETPGLGGGEVPIGYTIDTRIDVSGEPHNYYHATATDYAGNEGEASTVENTFAGVPHREAYAEAEDIPEVFALGPATPNPFTRSTEVRFDLPEACHVSIVVFDVEGRSVETLVEGEVPAGRHAVLWPSGEPRGALVGPGVYFVKMKAGDFTATGKLLLAR